MLLLGHTGLTVGLALGFDKIISSRISRAQESSLLESPTISGDGSPLLASLRHAIDYRIVLIGSMLPDIIDKPIGQYIIPNISNGRIFSHTLLFFLVLLTIGICRLKRHGKTGMLVLSLCSGFHMVLDQIWEMPRTLFWPFLGLTFDKLDLSDWYGDLFNALTSNPSVFVPEITGFIILSLAGIRTLRKRRVRIFLRRGALA